jgi:hypothetical protein
MFTPKRPITRVCSGRPAPVLRSIVGLAPAAAVLLCLLAWAAPVAAAPILVIDGGKLTGATGVDVGGTLYDVTFVEGSCATVFTGCDEASDFTFTNGATALAAINALADQVFLDGSSGAFDTEPSLTFGCTFSELCIPITPYQLNGALYVDSAFFYNAASVFNGFGDFTSLGIEAVGEDYGADARRVYAQWALSPTTTPVPEPATLTLFGVGLAVARLRMLRRQRRRS